MSSLAKATSVVLVLNLLSKTLGFLRDATLAAHFGATNATDAYLVAYTLPYSVQAVLGMAFLLVMVPLLTHYINLDQKEKAYKIAGEVMGRLGLLMFLVVSIGMLLAGPLTKVLAPGFSPQAYTQTTTMMRIMLPSIFFMSFAMLFSGILNGEKKFALAAFGPASVNLVVIASILLLGDVLGIHGVAFGTLAGFIVFAILLYIGVYRQGFRLGRLRNKLSPQARQVLYDILPVTLSVSVAQIFLMVGRAFASGLTSGSVTSFDFAYRIISLPVGIVAAAVVTTGYPLLTQGASRGDKKQVSDTFSHMLRHVILWAMPAAMGIMVLREPLVRLLLQRGSFDQLAAQMTSESLLFFSLLTLTISVDMVITRGFYAHGDYKWPIISGVIAIIIQIVISSFLVPLFDHQGVAGANAIAHVIYTSLLLLGFYRRKRILDGRRIALTFVKFSASTLLMGWIVLSIKGFMENFFGGSFAETALILLVSAGAGILVYFAGLWALKAKEMSDITKLFIRKRRSS